MIINTLHDYTPQVVSLINLYKVSPHEIHDATWISEDTIRRIKNNKNTRHPKEGYTMNTDTMHMILQYIQDKYTKNDINIKLVYTNRER